MHIRGLLSVASALALIVAASGLSAIAQPAPSVEGTQWRLELLDGAALPPDARVTLTLEDGQMSGRAPVNRCGAPYELEGDALRFGPIFCTRMYGPEHLMVVERAYIEALESVRSYRLRDGRLEMLDGAGAVRLVFVPDEAATALSGSAWTVVLLDGEPLPEDAVATGSFTDDQLLGHAPINHYFASYTIEDDTLRFRDIGRTLMAGPDHLLQAENRYLQLLEEVRSYRIVDGRLALLDEAGETRIVMAPDEPLSELPTTAWRLELLAGAPVPDDANVTAIFADTMISGYTPVNRYTARYEADQETLTIRDITYTEMAGPRHLMEIEDAFLRQLRGVQAYRIADGRLHLLDAAGQACLVFTPEVLARDDMEIIDPDEPVDLVGIELWVPMRPVAEWMGASVEWDGATATATVTRNDRQFVVDTRTNRARGAGLSWTPDYRMLRPSGLIYVPLNALTDALGARVIMQPDDHVLILEVDGRRGTLTAP
jgi:heat shock protein HslJ